MMFQNRRLVRLTLIDRLLSKPARHQAGGLGSSGQWHGIGERLARA